MRYDTAKILVELFVRHLREQDNVLKYIKEKEIEEDIKNIRTIVGATMGAICLDALNPIFDEHPSLKPPDLQ